MTQEKLTNGNWLGMDVFSASRIGGRQENQDAYATIETDLGYLAVVCDGMGGGPAGRVASDLAVSEIVAEMCEPTMDNTPANILVKAIRRANMAILEMEDEHPELVGMGTTVAAVLINANSAIVAHVGDSRVYQLRCGHKIFRTFDHSLVFEYVSKGLLTEEQARLSAESNIITRALGVKPDVEVDVKEIPYERGDRFVITTDGVHGMMPESDLLKMLGRRGRNIGAMVDNVVTLIDDRGFAQGGGHDNMTIVMIETKTDSKLKPSMTREMRWGVMALTFVCLLSLLTNVFQSCGRHAESTRMVALTDTISARDAQIKAQHDSIKMLNDTISKIRGNKKVVK